MKKITLLMIILLLVAVISMTTPAAAREERTPVGDRIGLYSGITSFKPGKAFHIKHGWVQPSDDDAIGIFDFQLEVDDVYTRNFYRDFSVLSLDIKYLSRIWVYNFPEGLPSGTHTFTGHWYAPCQYAVDYLGYAGPCVTPNQKVETNSQTLTIIFE